MNYFTTARETLHLDAASRSQLRGQFIVLSDGVTHYELSGPAQGELVVLTGGLTVPLFYWDALAPVLHAEGLRTLTFSGYGRGYSTRVRIPYDDALFVRQLRELCSALGLQRPLHVVGTSMGAIITAEYALAHASSVATLSFIGPAGFAARRFGPHRMLRADRLAEFVARRFGYRILEGHLGHNIREPRRAKEMKAIVLEAFRCEGSLHAFFDTLQHLPLFGRAESYKRVGRLSKPTLLLWGADDNVTPLAQMTAAEALLCPQERHVLANTGHMAAFERPAEVGALLARFVHAHPASGVLL